MKLLSDTGGDWGLIQRCGPLSRDRINYASFQGRHPEDHTNTFSKLPSVLIKCFNKTTQPWYQSITLITNSPSRSCFHSSDGSMRPALLLDERRWKFFRPLQSSLRTIHIMHNVQHYNIQWQFQKTYKKRNYVSTLSLEVVLTNTLINIQHFLIFLFSFTSLGRFDLTQFVVFASIRRVPRWFCTIRFVLSFVGFVQFDSIRRPRR